MRLKNSIQVKIFLWNISIPTILSSKPPFFDIRNAKRTLSLLFHDGKSLLTSSASPDYMWVLTITSEKLYSKNILKWILKLFFLAKQAP